jgi:hypothetical protein
MTILIIDGNFGRAEETARVLRSVGAHHVFIKASTLWYSLNDREVLRCDSFVGIADLVILHDNEADLDCYAELKARGVTALRELLYGGAGVPNGVPRSVNVTRPLTRDEAVAIIVLIRDKSPDEWPKLFPTIWSGVPQTLLAWALRKQYGPVGSGPSATFDKASEEYESGCKDAKARFANDTQRQPVLGGLPTKITNDENGLDAVKTLFVALREDY